MVIFRKTKRVIGIALIAVMLTANSLPSQIGAWGIESLASVTTEPADTWDGTADTSWYLGHENETDFEISTAEQLAGMAKLANEKKLGFAGKTIRLMNDLDLDSLEWSPIGIEGYNMGRGAFEGTFDGQHHVIRNLSTSGAVRRHGLFAVINGGAVKNLGIENADIFVPSDAKSFQAGILVDWCHAGKIYNCYTTGTIVSERAGGVGLAGIAGQCTSSAEIAGCYSSASIQCNILVKDSDVVGGIVGQWETARDDGTKRSRISDCYFDGEITCTSDNSAAGGILGADFTFGSFGVAVENCFVKPREVNYEVYPGNFCYIAAVDENGTIKNCYYSEPDQLSGNESEYYTGVKLVVDWSAGTAGPDPDYVADVKQIEDMGKPEFLELLSQNASKNPPVTWSMGQKHPIFSWDRKNAVPILSMTATASNAEEATVAAMSDQDGTLYCLIGGPDTPVPGNTEELARMTDEGEGVAGGSCRIVGNQIVNLKFTGLQKETQYTAYMAVKEDNGIWSRLIQADFTTTQAKLSGIAMLSGFPVAGEELTAEVVGIQEDAQPVFTWYRGSTRIDGADSDSYLLSVDDIGSKVHVEVTAGGYKGKLISNSTPKIAEEYTVTKIDITSKPDKMIYLLNEDFDSTGMEVTAYLTASASNATPSNAQKVLTDSEYSVDYDFQKIGKATVVVSYMGESAELEVFVTDETALLSGTVTLSGIPIAGETLTAETAGMQKNAKPVFSWYRDKVKIDGATGQTYVLSDRDIGHRIHAEVTAAGYAGKLVSDPTELIRSSYVVSGIAVTKYPDKMEYQRYEKFDGTGMEVTAYLKVNILDPDVAVESILKADQYEISYDFSRAGISTVTITFHWNGAVYTDSFPVSVKAGSGSGSSSDSGSSESNSSGGSSTHSTGAPIPEKGTWQQRDDETWGFEKEGGIHAADEWLYVTNNGKNEWFRFDENGTMETGWFIDRDGRWYYLETEHNGSYGAMRTGWILGSDGYWYYLDFLDGSMKTGWQVIESKWYYFNPVIYGQTWIPDQNNGFVWSGSTLMPYGAMYADTTTPDGYRVGPDGSRIE